ncbi:MAG TPA: LytTR family DNA-binding domain-containing protein [Bacteroidales bacterium]|nr:LytTR family DNA-binding domain-containing protein [Bacteroidales bacterium]
MYKALIIEDEKPAAEHLQRLINQSGIKIEVDRIICSVDDALVWFNKNPMPDLIFLDIQLSDGLSFEIFNYVDITCPIIFTTAYEEYAIKAFKVNSIDYLLKPIGIDDLKYAIGQFASNTYNSKEISNQTLKYKVDQVMKLLTNNYKSRFVVNVGMHIKSIEVEKISLFYSLEKSTFLLDDKGKTYDVNYSLDQIESLTDPRQFFRISRKHIINITAITDIISFTNSRLKLKISNSKDDDILVSRSKLAEFRKWLER